MSAPPELPEIVTRAFDVSRRAGNVTFCRNETGRLLATLAATREGTMAEFGTGCGVGTAWLRSGVRGPQTRILTAELDPTLAEAASEIFADDDQVEVVSADWSTLRDRGPFALLFLDAREPKDSGPDAVADLLEPGGVVVLDDFTPCEFWPPVYGGRVDVLRVDGLDDQHTSGGDHHRHRGHGDEDDPEAEGDAAPPAGPAGRGPGPVHGRPATVYPRPRTVQMRLVPKVWSILRRR